MIVRRYMLAALVASLFGCLAAEFTLELEPGWNLVSLPIAPDDPLPQAVFGGVSLGTVWEYAPEQGCYVEAEQIQPGRGYWVYAPVPAGWADDPLPPLTVTGSNTRGITVPLHAGWNLLGPISYEPYGALPVPLTMSSGTRVQAGTVWAWRDNRYYQVDSLPCGTGAWVRSPEAGSVRVSPNPVFAGAVMAYSPEVGAARAHWPEADDDRTVPEEMLYRVYAAVGTRTGLVDDANLVETVVGTTQAEVSGLTPGATYEIAVVAEDGAGNRNYFNRTVLTVPVMAVANVMAKTPRDIAAEGIDVTGVSTDGAVVTVANAGGLAVGDLIVFDNPNGQGLKRIVGVEPTRDGVELATVDACLAEAVDTGVVCSSLVVDDMDGLVPTGSTQAGTLVYRDPAGAFQLTRQGGDGQGASRDEMGVIEGRYEGEADLGSGLSVGYGVGFKPIVATEARFESLSLKYCRIVATGEFSLDARAKYELAGELSFNPKKRLFGVSHTFYYQVGLLPVWQDVGLDFYAEMEVTAAGALNMEAVYSAAKTVEIGVEYDDGAWRTVTSDGFAQSVTFDVSAEGTLLATVKIYPVLWTKFYSALAASLYVEPTLQLDSQVRFLPLPVETTKFDTDFLVDSHVEAGFEIFDWGKSWPSPSWTMIDIPIFGLPEIEFVIAPDTVGTNQPTAFMLDITAGVSNQISPSNIKWWVESTSEPPGSIIPTIAPAADGLSATVTATEPGEYRLWASAYGSSFLGTLGKRYASTTFVVQVPLGDYLIIDLSAGPEAATYPVSYLAAVPAGGWTAEHKTTKLVLRRIPAGIFIMGSPAGELGHGSDETQHQVTLTKDLYVGVFEVTQKQWDRVMGTWPSYFDNATYRDTRPVEQVSYNDIRGSTSGAAWPVSNGVDATSFMGKLRQKTGLATLDLPTEAQWEYACRAGTTTALNSGKNLTVESDPCPNMAEVGRYWYNGGSGYNSGGNTSVGTAKAGSYAPNAWGLYDMHGNAWEWCLDWYGTYPGAVTDPLGMSSGSRRVLRGGAWDHYARYCRSAYHNRVPPDYRSYGGGFRVRSAVPVQ